MMSVIYHIANKAVWESDVERSYRGDSLDSDGFIHCSTREQVLDTAERYYHARTGLVLLEIEDSRLTAPLRYEVSTGGRLFPHLYGPLNRVAVTRVHLFEPLTNGGFVLPEEK
jgi:uncharacterized protein (DUF952 family)